MTEKIPSPSTQTANPSQIISSAGSVAVAQEEPQKVEPTVEEEPYTIKCICSFSDDDGNTIYCETCDSWQHIECYYPDNVQEAYRDDFVHSCVECKPRPLDRQKAFERQKARLSMSIVEEEAADKKPKRPPSKSHKKKPKPTDLQLNGHVAGGDQPNKTHASGDHPPPSKKAKSSHKTNHSISSQAAKRSPSYGNGRTGQHGHPPSPATTPPDLPSDFELHTYSSGFISSCSESDAQIVHSNSFANLMISNTMSLWLREPQRLRQETGQDYDDVFQNLPSNIDTLKRPLRLETKQLPHAPEIQWKHLTAPATIEKDIPLMELNGQIGLQRDYCADPSNRWEEMTSPLPFVFFHPLLPLCIDTRREGSEARYVRRSCKPNAVLDTFLSDGSEYHFWLVSDRRINANEQITIPWDFRFPKKAKSRMLRLLGLGDDEATAHDDQDVDETEYHSIATWVYLILSEYGGCACDLGPNCAFARFHRNYHGRTQPRAEKKKKSRKPKAHTISPTSTGHATNSRAPSEGHLDEGADNDGRSTPGARSKPPSRDRTPTARQGSFDTLGILTEPTDRDKRKVAMVEDSFRRMEQQPPAKKKKRVSDGTGTSGATKSRSRSINQGSNPQTNGSLTRQYVDAGTSRSKSGSPASATFQSSAHPSRPSNGFRTGSTAPTFRHASVAPPSNYCDAAVQTDPVEGEWFSGSQESPRPKRRIISLSKRLLESRHRCRLDDEVRRKQSLSIASQSSPVIAMDIDSPTEDKKVPLGSPTDTKEENKGAVPVAGTVDVAMTDVPSTSPQLNQAPVNGVNGALTSPVKSSKSPDLRVQMPPVPAFGSPASATTTPLTASSMIQSPFSTTLTSPFGLSSVNGVAANPSPVKKKMSLSDYTKSRKVAAARPSVGTSLKPSVSNADDPKSAVSVEGVTTESPTIENGIDAALSAAAPQTNGSV
ncbi:uncharacterized protein E0L32_010658 [Thyridium curvatum]|uniref:SET domain-containing protein n=1 Tax=Thyridium curvatum TaxID=1093900 RepID=A0A507ATX4_9PEZI|nr:uncharacterized protein E0L32_010658 [Thyridium curvatum]TPX07660.1 hypothetical protein E0L32_010658 [Thyridium curvatum]